MLKYVYFMFYNIILKHAPFSGQKRTLALEQKKRPESRFNIV